MAGAKSRGVTDADLDAGVRVGGDMRGTKRAPNRNGAQPDPTRRDPLDPHTIERRAYERFEERGGQHGRDQDDWFEAERELIQNRHRETD